MSSYGSVFKQEVGRLARREVKAFAASLKRASARHRREIAALKRVIAGQGKAIKTLLRQVTSRTAPANETAAEGETGQRYTARSVQALRKKLGLSAAALGQLIGVSSGTIYAWEQGTSRPRRKQLPKLLELRSIGRRDVVARLETEDKRGGARKKRAAKKK